VLAACSGTPEEVEPAAPEEPDTTEVSEERDEPEERVSAEEVVRRFCDGPEHELSAACRIGAPLSAFGWTCEHVRPFAVCSRGRAQQAWGCFGEEVPEQVVQAEAASRGFESKTRPDAMQGDVTGVRVERAAEDGAAAVEVRNRWRASLQEKGCVEHEDGAGFRYACGPWRATLDYDRTSRRVRLAIRTPSAAACWR